MYIVMHTQFCENYGVHDWNGQGECPSYWKNKGGDTYIFSGVTMEQAESQSYWAEIESLVSHRDDYSEEFVIDSQLVDDCDYVEGHYTAEWETPIFVSQTDDGWIATKTSTSDQAGLRKEVVKQIITTSLPTNTTISNVYHMEDGSVLNYQECCDYILQLEESQELNCA